MRILFAGSPAIAVPSLKVISEMELGGNGIALAGLLTNPDSKRGRRGRDEPTDVSAAAAELDALRTAKGFPSIPQLKPEKLDGRFRAAASELAPDLLVSFAYGRIFGPKFLALFPLGGINIHPSLLPKYRGASPIPAIILAREEETGICIQKLAAEMDAGDILAVECFRLSGRATALSLGETTGAKAALLLRGLLSDFRAGIAAARPQEGEAIYCSQIKKEAGLINWNLGAAEIDARIRAYTPWPLSFTRRGKETLFILEAEPMEAGLTQAPGTVLSMDKNRGILIQTGKGILAVTRLQWQAKKAMDWKPFCNGARDFIGSRLG
jgi:methionyl-tRNA formyltransferase